MMQVPFGTHIKNTATLKGILNKCYRCDIVIHKIHQLLDSLQTIEMRQALKRCPRCENPNPSGSCKRCNFFNVVNKLETVNYDREKREEYFNSLILRISDHLRGILNCAKIGRHDHYDYDTTSIDELQALLRQLNPPAVCREPYIGMFPGTEVSCGVSSETLVKSKQLLTTLLSQIKSAGIKTDPTDEGLNLNTSICKDFKGIKGILPKIKTLDGNYSSWQTKKPSNVSKVSTSADESKTKNMNLHQGVCLSAKSTGRSPKSTKSPKSHRSDKKGNKGSQGTESCSDPLQEAIILETDLSSFDDSVSFIECDTNDPNEIKEMIKGNRVGTFKSFYNVPKPPSVVPIIFRAEHIFQGSDGEMTDKDSDEANPVPFSAQSHPLSALLSVRKSARKEGTPKTEDKILRGGFTYKLSDPRFIDKGWTMLPTQKSVRRMDIFKMVPAGFNWFDHHKYKRIMHYDSGEKLAEIDGDGTGSWYYRNGRVALKYYNSEALNNKQRYLLYCFSEKVMNTTKASASILAAFDYLGNGVVYDCYGNERLIYNQSEGVILDINVGPTGRWHWHSLNMPANIQHLFVDTVAKNPDIEELIKNSGEKRFIKNPDQQMLEIEFENFVKEKSKKLLRKYKPFEIRMKALKINNQFSLHIVNQSKIYLMFRDGATSIKLNIGMVLKSDELIDTDDFDVFDVTTYYGRQPLKTQNLGTLQGPLKDPRKNIYKHRMREAHKRQ